MSKTLSAMTVPLVASNYNGQITPHYHEKIAKKRVFFYDKTTTSSTKTTKINADLQHQSYMYARIALMHHFRTIKSAEFLETFRALCNCTTGREIPLKQRAFTDVNARKRCISVIVKYKYTSTLMIQCFRN
jgi:hypothetical protein